MKKLFPYLVIIVLGIGAYYQVMSFDFVWDDLLDDLLTNPLLQEVNLSTFGKVWQLTYWDKYIPVTFTVRALLKLAGGNDFNPVIFHLFSLLLHIINAILVYKLLQFLVKKRIAALLGALVFLLHPLQVESVAWVTANEVLLSTFFGLLSLWNFLIYSESRQKKYYILSMIMFALSLLSRPGLIALPIMLLLFELMYYRRNFIKAAVRQIPFFILVIPAAIIQLLNQSGVDQEIYSPIWIRPFVWFDNLGFYLTKMALPLNLRPDYHHLTRLIMSQWTFYVSILLTLMIIFWCWKKRKKQNYYIFGLSVFVIGMLPVSGFLPYVFQNWSNVADRYIYFSMLGVSIIIAFLVMKSRILELLVSIGLGASLLLVIFFQLPLWSNDINLWEQNIERSGKNVSAFSFNNLGIAHERDEQPEAAIFSYSRAIEIDPEYESAYNNRGLVYFDRGEIAAADNDFHRTVDLNPEYALGYYNLGRVKKRLQQYENAEVYFIKAAKLKPDFGEAYNELGYICALMERWQDSDIYFERAKSFAPFSSPLWNNLGLTAELRGNNAVAEHNYTKAIGYDQKNLNAYNNRANLYYREQNFEAAVADFDQMITLDPQYQEAYYNRGTVLLELEKYDFAIRDFTYVLELDSLEADAWLNRSIAHYHLSELESALFDAGQYLELGGELHPGYMEALALALKTNFQLKRPEKSSESK
ncbi:MAG: tetratricopeptide repeat protein [Candidatus Cloacimonetes bacterium]|nr:tetratricopeptide repeat protein [Candidatus Cloacimonadota bacterium]